MSLTLEDLRITDALDRKADLRPEFIKDDPYCIAGRGAINRSGSVADIADDDERLLKRYKALVDGWLEKIIETQRRETIALLRALLESRR